MNHRYTLSIVILTMNRKDQLLEALQSCVDSVIPDDTEFVIVDNHSTDNTEKVVREFFEKNNKYEYVYEYEDENLGVGGGRARAYAIANGKYLYFLDDDAVIASESKTTFFTSPIIFFEKHRKVASITTRIEDSIYKENRNDNLSFHHLDGRPLVFFYLGGSHFLRKSAFDTPLYFPIKYGSEEYAPSIIAQDKGFCHVYFDDIYIIHKPKVNKWVDGTANMEDILIRSTAITHATKVILYPIIFRPILSVAYYKRCKQYLRPYKGAKKKCDAMIKDVIANNKRKKIRISTVMDMYKKFGLTVF